MYTVVIASKVGNSDLMTALKSVHTQTLTPDRVLVVVDSGNETSEQWVLDVQATGPRTEVQVSPGSGMAAALTQGICAAESEYVAFLDSDDVWFSGKQEVQVNLLKNSPNLHAVSGYASNVAISEAGTRIELRSAPCVTFTATTFRRGAFDQFGFPDPSATHHTWLYRWWSRARASGIRTSNVDYVGLERRIHGKNSWIVENEKAHSELFKELRAALACRRENS